MIRTTAVVAVLALALLTGCGAPTGPPAPVPPAPTTPAPTTSGPVSVTEAVADGTGFGLLTAVRVAAQDGADRIVFEFESAVPGHRIGYVDLPVLSDPAGEEVPLDGTAALQVSLIGSSAYRQVGDTEPAADVPARIPAGLDTVTELVTLGDWEGVLVWAAGVRERTGFTVTTLDAPPRLVIDVAR